MEKLTKQGIKSLDTIGSKKHLNGKRSVECHHIFADFTDTRGKLIRSCQRCGYDPNKEFMR